MFKKEMMVKDEGGKEIIVEVGLAVIAVALLIVFRGAITTLVTNLINNAESNINNLFTPATTGWFQKRLTRTGKCLFFLYIFYIFVILYLVTSILI